MSLESDIAQKFAQNGWVWKLKKGGTKTPDEEDVLEALDEAARVLYDRSIGTQLEVGRLIVQKTARGHDVYLYVGSYE